MHSLDANERGYVKKFLKRHSEKGNINLDLIEALEKQDEYNEVYLKKQFKNLAVAKVQAWDEVLDALRIYNKEGHLTFHVYTAYTNMIVLMRKGFIDEAKKIAEKHLREYYERENFFPLIHLLTVFPDLYNEKTCKKSKYEVFDETWKEIIQTFDKLKQAFEYELESNEIHHLQQHSAKKDYLKKIKAFKKKSIVLNGSKPLSNTALLCSYDIHAVYSKMTNNTKNRIKYLESAYNFRDERRRKGGFYSYILLSNMLELVVAYIDAKLYEKAQNLLTYTAEIPIKHNNYRVERDTEALYLQLFLYNSTNQLDSLRVFVSENNERIINNIHRSTTTATSNQFKIGYLISLLLLEKYTEALRWILECDNEKSFRTNDLNYQLVLVIEVILNWILGDMETAHKNAQKHAKNTKLKLTSLYKLLVIKDDNARKQMLIEYIQNKKQKSNLLLEYFDVFDWITTVVK